ncbi:hypothetical protein [Leuconostoc mesenteroides]|uniref:hypothetical protein n=1 Tax=Leuconostoc mesenteroides TaxID=1245 RepID=UPI0023617AA5|nr:hypothetical protein [Leuconostoc mesenteroides]
MQRALILKKRNLFINYFMFVCSLLTFMILVFVPYIPNQSKPLTKNDYIKVKNKYYDKYYTVFPTMGPMPHQLSKETVEHGSNNIFMKDKLVNIVAKFFFPCIALILSFFKLKYDFEILNIEEERNIKKQEV